MRFFLFATLICATFVLFPQIDLYVSSLFFAKNAFFLKSTLFAVIIYKATIIITASFALVLVALLFIETVSKIRFVRKKVLIYLLLVLLLGPGLIVNVIFKNHFGRARPSQIEYFGGDKKFTPALTIAHQCKKNCSFSSGHAAAAFYFLAFVPLLHGRKKFAAAVVATIWGSIVGFVRIIQGGHFLSDVVCSAIVVYGVSLLLHYLLFERNTNETLGSHSGNE